MKISELAQMTGVSTDTIRYYEKVGLLPKAARDTNNYRVYSNQHADYLSFIKNCRHLDMTQEEILRLLGLATEPSQPCDEINQLLDEHIVHVQERMQELLQVERLLKDIRQQCNSPTQVRYCGILEGLQKVEGWPAKGSKTHVN